MLLGEMSDELFSFSCSFSFFFPDAESRTEMTAGKKETQLLADQVRPRLFISFVVVSHVAFNNLFSSFVSNFCWFVCCSLFFTPVLAQQEVRPGVWWRVPAMWWISNERKVSQWMISMEKERPILILTTPVSGYFYFGFGLFLCCVFWCCVSVKREPRKSLSVNTCNILNGSFLL